MRLVLMPHFMVGSRKRLGKVMLSAKAPEGGVTINLSCNDPSVILPHSLTVPAGSQTATFAVTANDTGNGPTYVTISGSYNLWTQSTRLTELPAGYNLTMQNLSATGGNGCVLLTWVALPVDAIQGYNVYRLVAGTPVLLTPTPIAGAMFADTGSGHGLTNGIAYQYQVRPVNWQNQEGQGASVTATTTSAAPTLTWVTAPATATGQALFYASLSNSDAPDCTLLVDGSEYGGGGGGQSGVAPANQMVVPLNTASLANGTHTVQLIGYSNGLVFASAPLTVQTNNPISILDCGDLVYPVDGTLASLKAIVPANTTYWTVSVVSALTSTVVRTWQATTSTVELSWDGTDATGGQQVADGPYQFVLTAYGANSTVLATMIKPIQHL
jgi:hypothetical protein